MSTLAFRPVTKARWGDFEALFSAPGAPSYCWCMAWRATTQERKRHSNAERKAQMKSRVTRKVQVGLLAYEKDAPVAWVSVAPKANFNRLGGPEALGEKIWSLTCMFVPRSQRGKGLAHELIAGAVAYATKRGATILEAYPVEPDSPSYRYMGFLPAFAAAGFQPVATAGKRRHVMRKRLMPASHPES